MINKELLTKRARALSTLLEFLNSTSPDDYCTEDFIIDDLIRQILSYPERSLGKEPYMSYLLTVNCQNTLK